MKLYVLVRSELSKSQQAVQAGHAVAEFILHNSAAVAEFPKWDNGTLVYLKAPEKIFASALEELEEITYFKEPDLSWMVTALASLGKDKVVKYFENFKLI